MLFDNLLNNSQDFCNIELRKTLNLAYGENPHQKALLCSSEDFESIEYELLQGKSLSYNDFIDASLALEIAAEFFDVNALVIASHNAVVGASLASNLEGALLKALDSDPVGPFNSTIAFTKPVDYELSKKIMQIPFKTVIAPDFEESALSQLQKSNLKILKVKTPYHHILKINQIDIKVTPFGILIQEKDTKELNKDLFKIVTKKKPEQTELEDMIFAYKIVSRLKSSSAVIAKDLRTLGIASNKPNMISSVDEAVRSVCDSPKGAILAVDGTIELKECINIISQNRIAGIIQTADSKNASINEEIIKLCDKYEISMAMTGIRHYRH